MDTMADWLENLGTRPHRYFERIGSTNDEAAAWARAGCAPGAIVIADEQLAGRGRHGRVWRAAPGAALLMSMVLRPRLAPAQLPRVALMGAVALAEALTAAGVQPGIKWPNDVLIAGCKVAGILPEAIWEGDRLIAVVLGLGVNIRRAALSPDEARAFHATTLEDHLAASLDRGAFLQLLLPRLDMWAEKLQDEALLDAWRAYSVTLGRTVRVQAGDEQWQGMAEDIDDAGALILRLADGTEKRVVAGEVTLGRVK
ncbi:MAG: hypothetical protein Kow0077_03510 [Anaerolineae bacterium]